MSKHTPRRVRILAGQIRGQVLIAGHPVGFEANIDGANIDATFNELPAGVTDWEAFELLQGFLQRYTRGAYGDQPPAP